MSRRRIQPDMRVKRVYGGGKPLKIDALFAYPKQRSRALRTRL
jgi:hypothetical protein